MKKIRIFFTAMVLLALSVAAQPTYSCREAALCIPCRTLMVTLLLTFLPMVFWM